MGDLTYSDRLVEVADDGTASLRVTSTGGGGGTDVTIVAPLTGGGAVEVGGEVTVSNFPATQPISGTVTANAGSGTFAVSAATLPLPSGAATSALQTQPGVDIGDVTVNNGAGVSAVNIQDGGNSITVDGTVTANAGSGTFAISAAALPLPTGAATAALQTQPGVDIGDVTVNNGTLGSAVNIQDGGNSITVDGSVTANAGTNLNTSALALDATLGRSQGSTTSGQTGPLIQGAVTTAAPSYTTAQTSPLSLTTAGALRVDGSAVTQPISGSITATPWAALSSAVDGVLTLTSTGDNSLIAGGGGGTRNYVTSISASNTSTTAVRIDFKDGSTVKHSFYLAASGGGVSHIFPFPWRLGDNATLNAAISANVTDVRVSATGFRI